MPLGSTLKNQIMPRCSNDDLASIVRATGAYFSHSPDRNSMRVVRECGSERPVNAGSDRFLPDQKSRNSRICPVNSRNTPFRGGDRFVSDCAHHHTVLGNRNSRRPLQIGVSFGDFHRYRSAVSISGDACGLQAEFSLRLCIHKFRSRRPGFRRRKKMKIVLLMVFLCTLGGGAMAYDRTAPPTATDKTAAWWGHSPGHEHRNGGKTVRHHTGRRHLSTHPARPTTILKQQHAPSAERFQ